MEKSFFYNLPLYFPPFLPFCCDCYVMLTLWGEKAHPAMLRSSSLIYTQESLLVGLGICDTWDDRIERGLAAYKASAFPIVLFLDPILFFCNILLDHHMLYYDTCCGLHSCSLLGIAHLIVNGDTKRQYYWRHIQGDAGVEFVVMCLKGRCSDIALFPFPS